MGSASRDIQYIAISPPQVPSTPSSLEAKHASLKQKRGIDHTDPSKRHCVDSQPSPSCLISLEHKRKQEYDLPETPSNKCRCLNRSLSEVVSWSSPVQCNLELKWKRGDEITESHPSKCPNLGSTSNVAELGPYTVAVFPQVSNSMPL
jgi:hypothetical protein